jgi:hypothetical protein
MISRDAAKERITKSQYIERPKKPVNGFEGPIYAVATRNLICVSLCVLHAC